jgi:hypothetical protein
VLACLVGTVPLVLLRLVQGRFRGSEQLTPAVLRRRVHQNLDQSTCTSISQEPVIKEYPSCMSLRPAIADQNQRVTYRPPWCSCGVHDRAAAHQCTLLGSHICLCHDCTPRCRCSQLGKACCPSALEGWGWASEGRSQGTMFHASTGSACALAPQAWGAWPLLCGWLWAQMTSAVRCLQR